MQMGAVKYFRNAGKICSKLEGVTSSTVQIRHEVDVNVNKQQGESAAILGAANVSNCILRSLCLGSMVSLLVSQLYSVPPGMCRNGT